MLSNLDHRFRIINIVELISSSGNDSPGFAEDVDSSRNPQRVGYQVGTSVEENDLASSKLRKPPEFQGRRWENAGTNLIKDCL
jgi:hypothetical protein